MRASEPSMHNSEEHYKLATRMMTPEGGEEAAVPVVAATVSTVSSCGTVTPFDAKPEQWSEYAERLELYFIANDIVTPAKQRAILHAVGPATYKLLKTLASPTLSTGRSLAIW